VAACGGATATAPAAPSSHEAAGAPPSASGAAPAPAASGNVEVLLCDGKTKVNVPQTTPGAAIAAALMSEWLRKNPSAGWEAEERERHTLQPSADNSTLVGQIDGHTYGRISEQDVALWKVETERLATAGSRVFHSGDELGSTVGVSCDMCHPHAANTHPE